MKILVVVGTRPEVIKLAPVIRRLETASARFQTLVCATGQHRDLLDQALDLFGIRPHVDFGVMQSDQPPGRVAGRLLSALDPFLARHTPDWVIVQGDTTSAMAAALAAFHRGIKVAHVEAGLRTGDLRSPFPEELHRRIIDLAADLLFAPTPHAERHLLNEGVPRSRIHVTGNTVVDALLDVAAGNGFVDKEDLVLITAHRREHFGAALSRILQAVERLAHAFPQVRFVHLCHPNPRVAEAVANRPAPANLERRAPLDYRTFVALMQRSRLILTDSGGVQEEAPTFGTPVLVLRDRTERLEGIEAGVARLVGTGVDAIVDAATTLLTDREAWQRMSRARNPYGDGRAADRIVHALAAEDAGVAPASEASGARR